MRVEESKNALKFLFNLAKRNAYRAIPKSLCICCFCHEEAEPTAIHLNVGLAS